MTTLIKFSDKQIILLGLLVFLITAFFSTGYHHPDEHFQLLEFSNYKLGNSPGSDLPWEFKDKIRPALQPFLVFLFIKFLYLIKISNPFTQVLLLRIITAFLSWYVVSKTCLLLLKDFTSEACKKIFLFLNFFLWFIPFLNVRFSSENYSAITFLLAVYLILNYLNSITGKKLLFLAGAGLSLGFSFYFRFQIAFAIIGLILWLLFIIKLPWKHFSVIVISGLVSGIFCLAIDYWFYGSFELTPLNYYFQNIIEHKAAMMGSYPWWYYFELFITYAFPPLSLILLLFFLFGLYLRPNSLFTWCIFPFLLAHFAIDHKEMRFLFPVVFSFIYLTAIGIDRLITLEKYYKFKRILLIISLIINIPLLIIKTFFPSQEAINYYRFLYDYSSETKMNLICLEKDAYILAGLPVNFYKSPNVHCIVFTSDDEISKFLEINKPDSIYFLERNLSDNHQFKSYHKQTIYNFFPDWILKLNINNWQSRSRIWKIEKLQRN